jgi:hypothetical protein
MTVGVSFAFLLSLERMAYYFAMTDESIIVFMPNNRSATARHPG